jgi:plastocyanin
VKTTLLVLVIAVLTAGTLGLASCGTSNPTATDNTQIETSPPPDTETPMPVDNVEISMENLAFTPASVTIPPGTNITWVNNDSVTHTVVSDEGLFESDEMSGSGTFSHVFSNPGTYSYHCSLHPTMKVTITVQ